MAKDKKETFQAPEQQNTWDAGFDSSNPLRAQYFNEMRTNAYMNATAAGTILELWSAIRVNEEKDIWQVMHYMCYDLGGEKEVFKSEPYVVKSGTKDQSADMTFGEALKYLGELELMTRRMSNYTDADMADTYGPGKFAVVDQLYHNQTYFKTAGNIEGVAFDDVNNPFRRVRGKIMGSATFNMKDLDDAMTGFDRAVRGEIKLPAQVESGILSDIFNTASERKLSLDTFLSTMKKIAELDKFAALVGSLYLTVQDVVGVDDKFGKVTGFANEKEKETFYQAAVKNKQASLMAAAREIIPEMRDALERAEAVGTHTEPFEKFTAEAELYLYLLEASRKREQLEAAILSGGDNSQLIAEVSRGASKAVEIFEGLGGTQEEVDRLKAWVMNPKKSPIVEWLPGLLTRYYTQRTLKLGSVAARRETAAQEVSTLAADVKPPLDNNVNGVKKGNQPGL